MKVVIDTNALVILILGEINPNLLKSHKRASHYDIEDYEYILAEIKDLKNLVVIPNVWTEVDNLLGDSFSGEQKNIYKNIMTSWSKQFEEIYIESYKGIDSYSFFDLGLTYSHLLNLSINADLLITSDSQLSDYAKAMNVLVYDVVAERNRRF